MKNAYRILVWKPLAKTLKTSVTFEMETAEDEFRMDF
jgi:hypothetical protein